MNRKPKILLVDDEEAIRLSGKYSLEPVYDVITVGTTAKALELLGREQFNLVLLDVMIKGEDEESGIKALEAINKNYPKLPVLMLTGSVTWMQKSDELKKLGAYGYIGKPFDRKAIKEQVAMCLNSQ